ncbi:MAG: hypothetical protein U0Q15_02640 [Kineosporiaceae bacterium]
MTSDTPPRSRRPRQAAAPVEVRSISNPKPGWTIEDAVRLIDEGYSPAQVERTTGFAAAHAEAAHRAASKPAVRAAAVEVPEELRQPKR